MADFDALIIQAAKTRMAGDPATAWELIAPIAGHAPGSAVVQFELGLCALELGEGRSAIAALSRAVELDPALSFGWRALEQQHLLAGQDRTADSVRARAIFASAPPSPLREPSQALAEGRLNVAESLLRVHLAKAPGDATGLYLLAEVGQRLNRLVQCEDLLDRCLRLAPDYSAARATRARVRLRRERAGEALADLEWLLARAPNDIGFRHLKARALERVGDYEGALAVSQDLLDAFPDHPKAWLRHGVLLRALGRNDEAIAAYRRALDLSPGLGEALWALADIKTFRFRPDEVAAMSERLKRGDLPARDRRHLSFAVGKALEDGGTFREAFTHYSAANLLCRTELGEQIASLFADQARATFTPAMFAAHANAGNPAHDPIFIVGLPRSGSTLVEQILSCHAAVESTRELPQLWEIAHSLDDPLRDGERTAMFKRMAAMTDADFAALGREYLRSTRVHRRTTRAHFIDKMPSNFMLTGFIHLILPRAKIIDVRRHPMACGLACFRQNFGQGQAFTIDLAEFGRYYRDYVTLMAHFDAVLPGRVQRVIYERLVADPEAEIRQLLAHCDLPFEAACLRHHENPRAVPTPSAEQVRQPIYPGAVDHWRNFEPWLEPLKIALGPVLDTYPDLPP